MANDTKKKSANLKKKFLKKVFLFLRKNKKKLKSIGQDLRFIHN